LKIPAREHIIYLIFQITAEMVKIVFFKQLIQLNKSASPSIINPFFIHWVIKTPAMIFERKF